MVKVNKLTKVFKTGKVEVNALRGVDLNVSSGESLAIMGSSGSGKSTLLHIIGGIDDCTSGEVTIDGSSLSNMDDTQVTLFRRNKIGFVFQAFNLMPTLTVEENVILPLQISGKTIKDKKRKVEELLNFTGLYERRTHKPNQLSGGEQQRVAVARAFVIDPKIVLLDEPTGSLDSKNGEKILELICRTQKEFNKTVIMVTHSPFAAEYADKTIFMKDGVVNDSLERKDGIPYSAKAINDIMLKM